MLYSEEFFYFICKDTPRKFSVFDLPGIIGAESRENMNENRGAMIQVSLWICGTWGSLG